ncbi:DUF2867 domain-containing protein [Mesorhizobium sp. B2-5-4]|uniref:DUF2867 domain-containing protein n=1 Tax=Mesorhizobium sp. B2-5-4 TaxID=2589926 RepID=UPI001FEED24B|nr:DUF2867 domain-containing protein [Mesorhizobium sp. B2-5-4]
MGWLAITIRHKLVAGFGLKTSSELRDDVATDRIDFFRVYDRRRHEIVLGEDDRHLDFRLSVLVEESASCRRLVATTVVTFNHLGGQAYIAGIAPFHRLIVKSSLRRAERSGWVNCEVVRRRPGSWRLSRSFALRSKRRVVVAVLLN